MTSEFQIIEQYFAPLAGPHGLSLMDDAACIPGEPGTDFIVTKDLIVEGVHFRSDDDASLIAQKALGVNVSDCVAKGAEPFYYWLGLALPQGYADEWLKKFSNGLSIGQQQYGCLLGGGDTTSTKGPITISITMMGKIPAGMMVKRSGAQIGDDLYVTGTLGDAALGLQCLEKNLGGYDALTEAYFRPKPPAAFAPDLRTLASSGADISDGLIADAGHIARASGVGMLINQVDLPKSQQATLMLEHYPEFLPLIWSGGDDYQLLFSADASKRNSIAVAAQKRAIAITRIGKIIKGNSVHLLDLSGEIVQVTHRGHEHFKE